VPHDPRDIARSRPLTIEEAGEVSGLGQRLIRRAVSERRIGILKLGPAPKSPIHIPQAALDQWLEESYQPPTTNPPPPHYRPVRPNPGRFPRATNPNAGP
jgi:excisionase family DNA binding protein